jgi:molecular chaperone GrpE
MENRTVTQEPNPTDDIQDDLVDIRSTADVLDKMTGDAPRGDELSAQVERLQDELARAKEQILRAHADAQNVRRRAEQDIEKAHKFGLEKFVNDVLPVTDNLERAAAAAADQTGDFAAVAEGVQLTLRTLLDALKRHGVEVVNPEGEPFNPQLHQAISAVKAPDTEPNTVLNVFQHGYTLHGRLVRPAMVVVAKAPEQE